MLRAMTTTKEQDMNGTTATGTDLFDQLREALSSPERIMRELIDAKAWESRGYDSLSAAWTPVMGECEVHTPVVRMMIARQMLEEGTSQAVVLDTVKGVGPAIVAAAVSAMSANLPADNPKLALAATVVRRSSERADGKKVFKVAVQGLQAHLWEKRAAFVGKSVEELLYEAGEKMFSAISVAMEQAEQVAS